MPDHASDNPAERTPETPPIPAAGYMPPDMRPNQRSGFPEHLRSACSRCGYDLANLPPDAPVCPECGIPIGKAWDEGRASVLSIVAVAMAGLSLMGIGCTGGGSAALAIPGLLLGLWARRRAHLGIDTPVSAPMAMGAIIMSGIILGIGGFIVLSFVLISVF